MIAFLVSFLLRSAILGVLGLGALALLKRRSAALQHAVVVGTVIAMVALPLIAYLAPANKVEVSRVPDALVYLSVTTVRDVPSGQPGPPAASTIDWGAVSLDLWVIICCLLLARMALGLFSLGRRVAGSRTIPFERPFRVVEDSRAVVPMMVWLGRSIVLLPSSWPGWSGERLKRVLAHEEAHVRRGDWFSQIFLLLASAVMWPNPLVHLLVKRARALAEHAADDLVLASGAEPSCYASDLLEIARGTRATAPAYAIPMAAKPDVARRIEMILSKTRQRGALSLQSLLVSGLLLAAIAVPVATWALTQRQGQKLPPAHPGSIGLPTGPTAGEDVVFVRIWNIRRPAGSQVPGIVLKTRRDQIVSSEGYLLYSAEVTTMSSIDAREIEGFVAKTRQAGGQLVNAPALEMFSGHSGSVTCDIDDSNKNRKNTISVTPSIIGNTFDLRFDMMTTVGGREDRVLSHAKGEAKIANGRALVLVQQALNSRRQEIITILLPTKR